MRKRRDYQLFGNGAGMTLQEIADELGISNARVQQLLRSALQKLCAREMTILLKMKEEAVGLQPMNPKSNPNPDIPEPGESAASRLPKAEVAPTLEDDMIRADYEAHQASEGLQVASSDVAPPVEEGEVTQFEHPVDELAQRVINANPPTSMSAAYRQVAKDLYHTINPIGQGEVMSQTFEEWWISKEAPSSEGINSLIGASYEAVHDNLKNWLEMGWNAAKASSPLNCPNCNHPWQEHLREGCLHRASLDEGGGVCLCLASSPVVPEQEEPTVLRSIAHALWNEGSRLHYNLAASLEMHPKNWHKEGLQQRLAEWHKAAERYFYYALSGASSSAVVGGESEYVRGLEKAAKLVCQFCRFRGDAVQRGIIWIHPEGMEREDGTKCDMSHICTAQSIRDAIKDVRGKE